MDPNLVAKLAVNFLNIIPIIVGTTTIKNIFIAILNKDIFCEIFSDPSKPNEVKTIKGTVITLSKLIIAVNDIDNATSPFAKEVSILEVTPPGAAAIIITPMASSGEIGHNLTNMNATIGSNIIWQTKPIKKSLGCLATLEKSSPVNPSPKENIIKAKAKGKNKSVIIPII